MKTKRHLTLLAGVLVALGLTWSAALRAQDTPPPEPAPPDAIVAPAGEADGEAAPTAPEASDETPRAVEPDGSGASPEKSERTYRRGGSGDAVVQIGSDVLLEAGRRTEAAVAIMGSVIADGDIDDAAVAIMGDTTINGEVGDAAVAVLGSVTVNGRVRGEVVAVLGDVQVGPNARIDGDVVSVGGRVIRAPGAEINGQVNQVAFLGGTKLRFDGLRAWARECLMLGRPLAFGPNLGWAWGLALSFFGFYLFLSLIFGRGITACAETLEQRPGMTFVTALLTLLLTPVAFVVLAFTGVGPLLLFPVMFVGTLFGKAAFMTWLGRRITGPMGVKLPVIATLIGGVIMLGLYVVPFLGFAVQKGSSFLGLGMVILAIMQSFRRDTPPPAPAGASPAGGTPSSPSPSAPQPPPLNPAAPTQAQAASAYVPGGTAERSSPGFGTSTPPPETEATRSSTSAAGAAAQTGVSGPTPVTPPPPTWTPPPVPPSPQVPFTSMPRAGFWVRLGAAVLDAILVGFVGNLLGLEDYFPMLYAGYCVVLWKLRGTTVGGVVCNLKVVRLDDRPLDWSMALVRALGGFLSLVAAGLGFIWIAFDPDRQAWHDKIAGTVVVRTPKGVSLI